MSERDEWDDKAVELAYALACDACGGYEHQKLAANIAAEFRKQAEAHKAEVERLRIRACEMPVDEIEDHFATLQAELADLRAKLEASQKLVVDWHNKYKQWCDTVDDLRAKLAEWLAWSNGRYPDNSKGDVIAAYEDGTIVLDDSITTWNPLRALKHIVAECDAAEIKGLEVKKPKRGEK